MKIVGTDSYGNRAEITEIREEKLQIAASLFKWSIMGGIAIATIISAGLIGVLSLGMFVVCGIAIKEGSR